MCEALVAHAISSPTLVVDVLICLWTWSAGVQLHGESAGGESRAWMYGEFELQSHTVVCFIFGCARTVVAHKWRVWQEDQRSGTRPWSL